MSDINTTSIENLPTTGFNDNTKPLQESMQHPSSQQSSQQFTLDESTINQIVNSLQQASFAGVTALPSRDIPTNTDELTRDPSIIPNYVPKPNNTDYINDDNDNENIGQYYVNEKRNNSLDLLYDDIQAPLLLSLLYFLFQLPILKKILFKYLPFLCNNDGNYNINGLIFNCGLFGFIYYILAKTQKIFTKTF
jgi:hypothetical protein